MKRVFLLSLFLFISIKAQESMDDLLWNEEVTIISATKRQQKPQESPYSITVITAEQIRNSGMISIPEILRNVVGVDYMRMGGSSFHLSIRGFNSLISNRILVLIDNRPIFPEFYGSVEWDAIPLLLEEIKQIEVIRGPGSALYGTNAFLGIVNIITKKPEELPIYHAFSKIGNKNVIEMGGLASGVMDNWAYKVSMGRFSGRRWSNNTLSVDKSTKIILDVESRILKGNIISKSKEENIPFNEAFRRYFLEAHGNEPEPGFSYEDYKREYIFSNENTRDIKNTIREEYGDLINILQQYYQNDKGTENIKINSQVDWFISSKTTLSLTGGYCHFRGDFYNEGRGLEGIGFIDNKAPYFRSLLSIDDFIKKKSNVSLNFVFNQFEVDFNYPAYRSLGKVSTLDESVSANIQHDFDFLMNETVNHFSYGFQWKRNKTSSDLFSATPIYPMKEYIDDLFGFFWQSEIVLTPLWKLYYGERYDYREKTGVLGAPRLSTVLSLGNWVVRSSFSHAFRSPSAFESYVDYHDMRGGELKGFHNQAYLDSSNPVDGVSEEEIRNNNSFDAETITSYEVGIGYKKKLSGRREFSLNVDGYYNKLNDLISYCSLNGYEYDNDDVFYMNMGDATALGAELGARFDTPGWSFFFNYSAIDIKDDILSREELKKKYPNLNEKEFIPPEYENCDMLWAKDSYEACRLVAKKRGKTPKHKINSGFSCKLIKGVRFSCDYHFVDKIKANHVGLFAVKRTAPAYHLIDANMSYSWGRFELVLRVDNVFDHEHYEYPKNIYDFDYIGKRSDFYIFGLEQSQILGRTFSAALKIEL